MGQDNTGILTSLFNSESLLTSQSILDCAEVRSSSGINSDQGMIYVFINKDSERLYVGSTINLSTRLNTYIHS